MDINSLKCFIVVAEEKNITKAAKRLFLTQQTLSSIIQRLENECQSPLLERKPVLRLTRAGETMLNYAKKIVDNAAQMKAALADVDRNCSATLRFGISTMREEKFFCPIWDRFHEKHPNVAISLFSGRTQNFYRLLSSGEISVFLGINAEKRNGFIRRDIARENVACAVSFRLLKEYHPELTVQDMQRFVRDGIDRKILEGVPCVRQKADPERGLIGVEDIVKNAVVESNHQRSLENLIKRGVGFGFIFPYLIMDEKINREDSDLWMMPYRGVNYPFTISLVYRDEPISEYLSDFLDDVESVMKDYETYAVRFK